MTEHFRTESANRALVTAQLRASLESRRHSEPIDLLFALINEEESQATNLLAKVGVSDEKRSEWIAKFRVATEKPVQDLPGLENCHFSQNLKMAITDADLFVRSIDRSRAVGTEELLYGLINSSKEAIREVQSLGADIEALKQYFQSQSQESSAPLPIPEGADPLLLADAVEHADIARIVDVAANRLREGLRVVEDYARFALDDPALTRGLKDIRHRLNEAMSGFPAEVLITQRDTSGDVGTHIMTMDEGIRTSPRDVLIANFKRATEALRSLEEYAKLYDVWVSGRFEVLRYDLYTLEKRMMLAVGGLRSLEKVRLCLLVGQQPTLGDLRWLVNEAIEGGVDFIQLREKNLPDRIFLEYAREIRIITAQAGVLFAVNDRIDIARLAGADAVHLGQEDLTIRDARRLVGPRMIVGVSTHESAHLESAVIGGAQYFGVGPVFPSRTKSFENHEIAGLGYVQKASETTSMPWFAIGGITLENLDQVMESGATRVAVSSAILKAERPRVAAQEFKKRLLELKAASSLF